jgi:hypothetical protein
MKRELIAQLHATFEQLVHEDLDTSVEFWLARDLQTVLGYQRWENFSKVISRAITACELAGYDPKDHFLEVTKMVALGSGVDREVGDYTLTRYACYLIAQNGDSMKDSTAFAQTILRGSNAAPATCREAAGGSGAAQRPQETNGAGKAIVGPDLRTSRRRTELRSHSKQRRSGVIRCRSRLLCCCSERPRFGRGGGARPLCSI